MGDGQCPVQPVPLSFDTLDRCLCRWPAAGNRPQTSRPLRRRVHGRPLYHHRPWWGSFAPRYLFRLMAGQGYQKEAAEERLKDLFEVGSLSEVTKVAATKAIDQLLNPAPQGAGRGATPDF